MIPKILSAYTLSIPFIVYAPSYHLIYDEYVGSRRTKQQAKLRDGSQRPCEAVPGGLFIGRG
jgi:hypothetical protein